MKDNIARLTAIARTMGYIAPSPAAPQVALSGQSDPTQQFFLNPANRLICHAVAQGSSWLKLPPGVDARRLQSLARDYYTKLREKLRS